MRDMDVARAMLQFFRNFSQASDVMQSGPCGKATGGFRRRLNADTRDGNVFRSRDCVGTLCLGRMKRFAAKPSNQLGA